MRQPRVRMWLSTQTSQSRPSCRHHHRNRGVLPVVAAVHAALSSSWPCDRFACAAWSACCWLSTPRHLLRSAGVHLLLRVHPPPAVSQSVSVGWGSVGGTPHKEIHTRAPHTRTQQKQHRARQRPLHTSEQQRAQQAVRPTMQAMMSSRTAPPTEQPIMMSRQENLGVTQLERGDHPDDPAVFCAMTWKA